jgi:hypothetical protein
MQLGRTVLMELHYLPCLEYFTSLLNAELVILEYQENYPKQTMRNRCYVKTANKTDLLTVPVLKGAELARDVRIDYGQEWRKRHWGCFQSAYGKSPFFEYYAPELKSVYNKQPTFLFDLNFDLLTVCLRFLGLRKNIAANMAYSAVMSEAQEDKRSKISGLTDSEGLFYKSVPYYQTFGNDFVSNLSIVDLLFNQGPESRKILIQSRIEQSLENKRLLK